jgi:hypothetical protein
VTSIVDRRPALGQDVDEQVLIVVVEHVGETVAGQPTTPDRMQSP